MSTTALGFGLGVQGLSRDRAEIAPRSHRSVRRVRSISRLVIMGLAQTPHHLFELLATEEPIRTDGRICCGPIAPLIRLIATLIELLATEEPIRTDGRRELWELGRRGLWNEGWRGLSEMLTPPTVTA